MYIDKLDGTITSAYYDRRAAEFRADQHRTRPDRPPAGQPVVPGLGSGWGRITYVSANVPSTRPDLVSVNPIDDYTWGAAARSVRDGRCHVIVIVSDRTNPKYGNTRYGRCRTATFA